MLQKRACLQLAKANLGGSCLNSRITKIYCQQKLTNKVEGKETVLNNNKKNRDIDLIENINGTATVYNNSQDRSGEVLPGFYILYNLR